MFVNPETNFREGGRTDNSRLQPQFRECVPSTGYSGLHGILTAYAAALTAAGGDPATQTINEAVTYLETMSNVDLVVAEY
jgi:hypothetical protein